MQTDVFLQDSYKIVNHTSQELILDSLLDLGLLLSLCVLLLVGLGPLAAEGRFLLVGELGILLAAERDCVVRLVPK